MRNVLYLTKLEIVKYLRQPMVVGFGVVFPIAWILMNGVMFGNDPSPLLNDMGTVDFMLPAYVFMIALVSGLSSLPLTISRNYDTKAIVRYSFTPIRKSQYICAVLLGNFLMVMLSAVMMFIVADIKYDLAIPAAGNILLTILAILVISVGVASFGVLLASVIKGFQSTLAVSLFVYFILLFITGATVPLPVMPAAFTDVSNWIPFSYMVLLLQDIWHAAYDTLTKDLLITLITTVACFVPAILLFRWKKA